MCEAGQKPAPSYMELEAKQLAAESSLSRAVEALREIEAITDGKPFVIARAVLAEVGK